MFISICCANTALALKFCFLLPSFVSGKQAKLFCHTTGFPFLYSFSWPHSPHTTEFSGSTCMHHSRRRYRHVFVKCHCTSSSLAIYHLRHHNTTFSFSWLHYSVACCQPEITATPKNNSVTVFFCWAASMLRVGVLLLVKCGTFFQCNYIASFFSGSKP